ncbi:DinB family protein [Tundrisphaera sp. TA3]|uniref:DinB family protein n=1 Tax=Tundrisphaera sp. TA3 TaxID=3435775 RepID=UPI003EB75EF6
MNAIAAIKSSLLSTRHLTEMLVSDLSDADLLVRPVPKANHIAWQLGNVIAGDLFLVKSQIPEAEYPALPDGFMEKHGPSCASDDGPDGFLTKAEYLDLLNRTRAATVAALEKMTEAELDRPPSEDMIRFAPTLGDVFIATANHTLMHAGQFSVVRRLLGKPVLI